MFEYIATLKSIRAYVRRLPCTCKKGKGVTRKERRFCDRCQAQLLLKSTIQQLSNENWLFAGTKN